MNSIGKENQPTNTPGLLGICLLLALAVWAVFGQTLRHEFIDIDDDVYVYENPAVAQGLSLKGVGWAFSHEHGANWHPLTTLTHMLDCQLYGLNPGGHHLTNVLLHTATVLLLFLILHSMTGAMWRSAFVAAVFAIHPLRVESVAWVAERKDVLSGFFFMLTVGAYVRYVRKTSNIEHRTSNIQWSYWLVLLLLTLGLMSKPMLVTLPFVLLLLDYWPLGRFQLPAFRFQLLKEKIPMLLLVAADCGATILAQKAAIRSVEDISFAARFGNALMSYAAYIGQMIYPAGLAVGYPHPGNHLSGWAVGLSALLLVLISAGVVVARRKYPFLLAGWLWYLGMLVPVIGIMQVGVQARADRYTYLPQIGLYVMVAWGAVAWWGDRRLGRVALRFAAAGILACLLVSAWIQTGYWRDSVSISTRTVECFPGYAEGHNNFAGTLLQRGRVEEAIPQFERALELKPDYADAHYNLGGVLASRGKSAEAIAHYERVLQLKPDYLAAHNNLAFELVKQGKLAEAMPHYERAIQLNPDFAEAHFNLAVALVRQGDLAGAIRHFQRALDAATAEGNRALVEASGNQLKLLRPALP